MGLVAWFIFLASPVFSDSNNDLKITIQQNSIHVNSAERPLLEYKYADAPFKPYIKQLFTPNGNNILRDAPHDHLHHHALMFAVSLNDISFWEESENAGKQEHQSVRQVSVSQNSVATFQETLVWKSRENEIWADELRTIQIEHLPKHKATRLQWTTSLVPREGPIKVGGSHYYGLGMRFIESMDNIGSFINSESADGAIFRGEERLIDANWCAYSSNSDFPVTVCVMNSPQNKQPATWFTMPTPFSYLSATLRYHEKPIEITQNSPLKLRYTVGLWDEIKAKNEIENIYQEWSQQD